MADPQFLDMAVTHAKVMSTLRRHKVPERVIEEVSKQFPTDRPTMRARTQTAVQPKLRRTGGLYSFDQCKIPYFQGYAYIAVLGDDGVDQGHPMWVVMCPKVDADATRADIRDLVRKHGIRSLNLHLIRGKIYSFPKKGVKIERATAMRHPGLYLESRWPGAVSKEHMNLVVVHQK